MADSKKHTFVMSDESLNCYGFRVLTDGIDLSAFEPNPVAFWNHKSDDKYAEENYMPIAKWSNLRKENGQLIGDLEVDTEDEEGKRLDRKITKGYVNAVSIYFDPIEFTEDPEYLVLGQTGLTIKKCLLLECSPVGKPGNYNAVKLKLKEGGSIALNSNTTATELNKIVPNITTTNTKNTMTQEQIALSLGLSKDATDDVINAEVARLRNATPPSSVTAPGSESVELANTKKQLADMQKERVETMLTNAKTAKKIDAVEEEHYRKLANLSAESYESVKQILDTKTVMPKIVTMLNSGGAAGTANGTATKAEDTRFMQLSRTDPKALEAIQLNNPAEFEDMKNEYLTLLKTGK